MPIYEYQCSNCGHHLEAFQSIKEEPLHHCPKCQAPDLKKLISSTSFQLKGTGWYVTDIRDKNKPKPAEAESSTKNDTTTQSVDTTKKETQPTAKTSTDKKSD